MTNEYSFYLLGGTITKKYDQSTGSMLNTFDDRDDFIKMFVHFNIEIPDINVICAQDSNYLTHNNLDDLEHYLYSSQSLYHIVVMGTDKMVNTAKYIGDIGKSIIFVGSFIPMQINNSDALFNLGFAMGAAKYIDKKTYIAMNGKVFHHMNVIKNFTEQKFE